LILRKYPIVGGTPDMGHSAHYRLRIFTPPLLLNREAITAKRFELRRGQGEVLLKYIVHYSAALCGHLPHPRGGGCDI